MPLRHACGQPVLPSPPTVLISSHLLFISSHVMWQDWEVVAGSLVELLDLLLLHIHANSDAATLKPTNEASSSSSSRSSMQHELYDSFIRHA